LDKLLVMPAMLEWAADRLTMQFGAVELQPFETLMIALALAAALAAAFRLWRIAQRERLHPRLAAFRGSSAAAATGARPLHHEWYGWFGAVVAASPIVGRREQERLLEVLAKAGIRRHGGLAALVASKVCSTFGLAALAWLLLAWRQLLAGSTLARSVIVVAALALGWRLPDLVLGWLAGRRRRNIEMGMPDVLDLLVVCAEAGLSLDHAIDQISRELRLSHPEIADEFAITAAEMRVMEDRGAALENLARRTGLEILRGVTATLAQAIRFGTSLSESLRVLAAEMRTARILRIEERAARLPVLLTIPLMLFILPALFLVIGTPVALRVADFFDRLQFGAFQ
jgi:tight adherence protein C